jgi:hypothetical protein
MTDPDEIARCAAARRARREAYHCGACGRPYKSQIGAAECDCPPIKLRMDVLGMSLAVESFQQACAGAVPVIRDAVRNISGAPVADDDVPPPSGWRDRPSLL